MAKETLTKHTYFKPPMKEQINPMVYPGLTHYGQKAFNLRIKSLGEYTPDAIIHNVTSLFSVDKQVLISKSRLRKHVMMRTIAMHEIRQYNKRMTLKTIGELFNRDHTTVVYSLDQYKDLIAYNHDFKEMVMDYEAFVK